MKWDKSYPLICYRKIHFSWSVHVSYENWQARENKTLCPWIWLFHLRLCTPFRKFNLVFLHRECEHLMESSNLCTSIYKCILTCGIQGLNLPSIRDIWISTEITHCPFQILLHFVIKMDHSILFKRGKGNAKPMYAIQLILTAVYWCGSDNYLCRKDILGTITWSIQWPMWLLSTRNFLTPLFWHECVYEVGIV